jgi:hypothetical protein
MSRGIVSLNIVKKLLLVDVLIFSFLSIILATQLADVRDKLL